MARREPLDALQDVLGHRFGEPALLHEALRHASAAERGRPSNQRLEFLGDRVLGLAIAAALHRRHGTAAEGDMARRLNSLVRRETCADRALALGIDRALSLGRSEESADGRQKSAILADACEAVLAALFLDAGFETAAQVVERVWAPLLDSAEADADPKTALQEKIQAAGEAPPTYRLLEREGPDHAPVFRVSVEGAAGPLGEGTGRSKREAEQNAARAALKGAVT